MNGATAFLDGSAVYGNNEEAGHHLRTFEGGLMRTAPGDMLPINRDCDPSGNNSTASCELESGDGRVNESPALAVLHTLMVRQHNHLAAELARVNPLWDDDTLYHEARRIVVAQIQHVTYREFLPAVLGENLAENLGLTPQLAGRFTDYDIDSNPATLQAAASAALSFSLAMLPAKFETYSMTGDKAGEMGANEGRAMSAEQAEELLYGMVSTMSRRVSLHISKDVRRPGPGSIDKVAEILLRGRDHGLPSYASWRQFCGLNPVQNFSDLSDIISNGNIAMLSSVYASVEDVDLFTGALAETPLKGAVVGPTLGCIMAHQFALLRKSDRFWYENDVPPSSFTRGEFQSH